MTSTSQRWRNHDDKFISTDSWNIPAPIPLPPLHFTYLTLWNALSSSTQFSGNGKLKLEIEAFQSRSIFGVDIVLMLPLGYYYKPLLPLSFPFRIPYHTVSCCSIISSLLQQHRWRVGGGSIWSIHADDFLSCRMYPPKVNSRQFQIILDMTTIMTTVTGESWIVK